MLKLIDLKICVKDKEIIKGIDLEVRSGETHVIMGKNGTGKSTICKAILNNPAYEITAGQIIYNNEDITSMPTNEIAKRGIFLLEQNPTEISGVSNAEILRTAMNSRGIRESIFEFNKRVNSAVSELHLDKSIIHRNVNENMSGGEKKKNELLHIAVLKPSLILLDELDSGLDVDSLKVLSEYLSDYQKNTNASIILITHHTSILKYIKPDVVHILDDGKFILEGDEKIATSIENYGFTGTFNMNKEDTHE